MQITDMDINDVKPYGNNPRITNEYAIDAVAESIKEFGFQQPIVVDTDNVIIVGHTRLLAAKRLGLDAVPVVVADNLTDEQVKAYRLADNKVSEFSDWDFAMLQKELDDIELDMSLFGFTAELDEDFDEFDLDDEKQVERVIVTMNCPTYEDYESIVDALNELAESIDATIAVKMA